MRTLFLHGMGARPKEWQLRSLIENNLKPYALHLDYSRIDEFEVVSKYIEQENIEFLIGRSHGGYIAYWLSEQYCLPCLIINPHFSLRLRKKMKPPIDKYECPICCVSLGSDDMVVDPDRSLEFLELDENPDKVIKIKMLNGVGHPLDPDTFSEQIEWGLGEISKIDSFK